MMLMLAVFSLGAYAQTQQGQSAVGFNIGYGFDSKNATLGVDYRYCITDAVRLSPSLTYFVKNDNHSTWAIDLNAHYVVKLSEMFGFYPLAGLSLSFWNWDAGHGLSHNETRLGANIGLGGEVYATDNLSIGLEVKYNIIKDFDQIIHIVEIGACMPVVALILIAELYIEQLLLFREWIVEVVGKVVALRLAVASWVYRGKCSSKGLR